MTNVCLTEFDEKKFVRTMKADGYEKGRADGVAEGVEKTKYETAKAMLKEGLSCDLVAKCTGLSSVEIVALTAQ